MLTFPKIDPILFSLGPFHVRWYGLMYIIGFVACYLLVSYQAKKFKWDRLIEHLDNINIAIIAGVILGGRLGYVLFYNLPYFLQHPLEIFATWQGGMSFHGGALGVLIALAIYSKRKGLNFWKVIDTYTVTAPIGVGFGRLGNFINGELFGRVTDVPWGMVFPYGGPLPRHPSQLYEAFLEGVVIFIVLWSLKGKPWQEELDGKKNSLWPHGSMTALAMILYGIFRSLVEFVREPDAHLGTVFLGMTMGQILSVALAGLGIILWRTLQRRKAASSS
ncbi:MAG: prolipoprotein diacylglyceryl transferase [Candidatus Electrothrix aestuarii]|uniref:Phosphatidylglycerol--prolipoprotein diacylglyceryl transferase n=1 Tax=Candidatus Electrothrix aestuarii TaxID=3062594 RepID=A0AAU8M0L2_9BACT|nr:prolipoprotein diacylglyceryl transferase [Candidatus Electrothrix aestuarii]